MPGSDRLCNRHRIAPILFDFFRGREKLHRLPSHSIDLLERSYYDNAARNTLLLESYREMSAALGERGLAHIPLKGIDLAARVYRNPALRPMSDLDVLLKPPDVAEAEAILLRLGYAPLAGRRAPAPPRPSPFLNSRYYGREDAARSRVHLHWHLLNASIPLDRYFERMDMVGAWERARPDATGLVRTLAPVDRFLHLCEHALKHSFAALIHLVDLALLLRGGPQARDPEPPDLSAIQSEARRTGRGRAAFYALAYLRDLLGLPLPAARELLPLRGPEFAAERWFDRQVRDGTVVEGMNVLVYLSEMPGLAERLRFAWRTLSPPRADLAAIDLLDPDRPRWRDYLARYGSAVRRLLGWLR